jgi:hypothetical protein
MNFCHISPTKHLEDFCSNQTDHLLLAHLVEGDRVYREWYQNRKDTNYSDTFILDNSAFEMYKQGKPMFESSKLIDLAGQVNADYVVLSDYPGEDWKKTRDAAEELAPQFRNAGFQTFYCPQAPVGNMKDLLTSYRWAANSDLVDYIGFSIIAIPNAYGVERDNKLQRFISRWDFMGLLHEVGILSEIYRNDKKVHFLGMTDGPREIALMQRFIPLIDTWDSSAAVWAGLNGIPFDDTPTGLLNGKFEKHVDFDFYTEDSNKLELAHENIRYINRLIEVTKDKYLDHI